MTREAGGRCLTIPITLMGQAAVWAAAGLFMGWETLGGPEVAGRWGLLAAMVAAPWTIVSACTRHRSEQEQVVLRAFEVGRESATDVRSLR